MVGAEAHMSRSAVAAVSPQIPCLGALTAGVLVLGSSGWIDVSVLATARLAFFHRARTLARSFMILQCLHRDISA